MFKASILDVAALNSCQKIFFLEPTGGDKICPEMLKALDVIGLMPLK